MCYRSSHSITDDVIFLIIQDVFLIIVFQKFGSDVLGTVFFEFILFGIF